MKYFKAIEIDEKPFIIWQSTVINESDPLIVQEDNLPAYVFGVCPWKIVDGEFAERTTEEMGVFEEEFNADTIAKGYQSLADQLKTETFAYDGKTFPLHEVARIYYGIIENSIGNLKVLTSTGQQYILLDENREAFIAEYKTRINDIVTP